MWVSRSHIRYLERRIENLETQLNENVSVKKHYHPVFGSMYDMPSSVTPTVKAKVDALMKWAGIMLEAQNEKTLPARVIFKKKETK
jgi:hypothetical protein